MKKLTKKILFQLNLLAAIGLLLSYTSNFITPEVFWPIAFFGLAYFYLLVINVFFFIFWAWRRKKLALLSLVVILVGFGNVGRYIQLRPAKKNGIVSSDTNQLRLISYNVRVFNTYKWSGEEVDRDSILHFVNSENPDIICLQEYLIHEHINEESEGYTKKLLTETPSMHVRYTKFANSNRRKFGIATFSKYPIVNRGSLEFKNSANTCIYSDILFSGDTIRIYNLHLQSMNLKKNYTVIDSLVYLNSKRLNEVRDISSRLKRAFILRAQQVDAVKEHSEQSPYPVVLCGDFNDTPVSYSYHQLLGNKEDSFREAGSGVGKTYRGKLPSYRIDYVFHDNNFKSVGYSTLNVKLSDHFPIVSTLIKAN